MNHSPKTSSEKKRIAVFYPNFAGGGAESVGLWILEALKNQYDLTLFTLSEVDLDKLNSMYGTQLTEENVKIMALFNKFLRKTTEFLRANNAQIRMLFFHLLIRYLKAHCHEYDLAISAYNATDLGNKGIQYVHWIGVLDESEIYKKVSAFSDENMKSNISLANSEFVAQKFQKIYGVEPIVVYPPVVAELPDISWEDKENAFICSGRLTEPKQPHRVIEILSKVRKKGFDVKLYMTGGGGGVYGWKYERFLKKKIKENSEWVQLHENLPYKDYVKVLAKCKYGFHFKQEPFGISIAEMVKAGAVPFVKNKGGQVEIVGSENQDLLFKNPEEAVKKVVALLSNEEKINQIRASLQERKNLFSTARFMAEINQAVDEYFENKQN